MTQFKLSLEERKSRHMLERHPRYDVLVNGNKVDELYFNMTGYRGSLMTLHGSRLDIGERGISAWKKAVSELNAEARQTIAANGLDARKLISTERTAKGDVLRCNFYDGQGPCESLWLDANDVRAGIEILGMENLTPKFFRDRPQHDAVPDFDPADLLRDGETWGKVRMTLGIFETTDPEWIAMVVGFPPASTGEALAQGTENRNLSKVLADEWGTNPAPYSQSIVFIGAQSAADLAMQHGIRVIRADALPGSGVMSERPVIFTDKVTSTGQRPDVLFNEEVESRFGDLVRSQGYRCKIRGLEPEDGPCP